MMNDFSKLDAQTAEGALATVAAHEILAHEIHAHIESMNQTTKHNLTCALFSSAHIALAGVSFRFVNSIERESGNGHTFNVKGVTDEGVTVTVYVETVD